MDLSTGEIEDGLLVPFGDLGREYESLEDELRSAVLEVLSAGWFVLGQRLSRFEEEFASYMGDDVFAVGVGSGTEALHLSLVAAGVEHGDYVLTVPNTAVPTVSAITFAGATPLFVDVSEEDFLIDVSLLEDVVSSWKRKLGRKLKAVIPVHLYGQCADMEPVKQIAAEFDLKVIEDACQAHGAVYGVRKAGTIGDYGAFSFYPSKNLGAYGDGGAIVTGDAEQAAKLKMLRNYGQKKRYTHAIKGFNSRLDELQAAILAVKLPYLDDWNARRREIAGLYNLGLGANAITPAGTGSARHICHLYVIRHPERDRLAAHLAENGIQTAVHYPVPVHLQQAYADLGLSAGDLPVSEKLAGEILSLPVFPQLSQQEIDRTIMLVNGFSSRS